MNKIAKEEVVKVMAELKAKGHSNEELAVMLSRTTQSIWRWSSPMTNSVPCKSDYEVLKKLTIK